MLSLVSDFDEHGSTLCVPLSSRSCSASLSLRRCSSWLWMVLLPGPRWTSNVGGGLGRRRMLRIWWGRPFRKAWSFHLSHGSTQTASRQVCLWKL